MPTAEARRRLLAGLDRRLDRLRVTRAATPLLDRLRHDPADILVAAGMVPDVWQAGLLRSPAAQTLLNCSRQAGKSTVSAALSLAAALLEPPALVLLLSPTERQSAELFRKVKELYDALGRPVAPADRIRDNRLYLELANGSRVVSLPGKDASVRCYSSVRLLVIDEAARVDDALYNGVRPMLAVSGGRLVALSTPFGRRGWFYDAWRAAEPWFRVQITAAECPRIPAAFLAQERRQIGERWYAQEYGCQFMEMLGAVFSGADIDALACADVIARPFLE
jgi:hypothetical protein